MLMAGFLAAMAIVVISTSGSADAAIQSVPAATQTAKAAIMTQAQEKAMAADTLPTGEKQAVEENKREDADRFEATVKLIKKYETLHQPRHWPLVGYGHLVKKGEKFSRSKALSESAADKILREDLLLNCKEFRSFGADSLLLGALAYNIGSGNVKRSALLKKLKAGDRDIRDLYLSHCRYRGKVHKQIQQRRVEEFDLLFEQ